MIQCMSADGYVAFEFNTLAEFREAFPEGVTEPGWVAVDQDGKPVEIKSNSKSLTSN